MDYLKRAKHFRTKKKLGQNFLVDGEIIRKIIELSEPLSDETLLEIGAGAGFVTEELAKVFKKVVAVEIDMDAIHELNSLPYSNIEIINKDILKLDISSVVKKPVKVVANIPYYITSPIIAHLLGEIDQKDFKNRECVKGIILMVQYEVAKRIVATEKSPSKEYGLLSILVNYWCVSEFICKVPANSFYPSPKVDSALVKLTVRDKPAVDLKNPALFRKITQACFGKRRKNIKNALSMGGIDEKIVRDSLAKENIDPSRRGETLSLQEYKTLTDTISEMLS